MKKISEAERTRKGLEMIEEIAADAACMDPKRSNAVDAIYRIAHTIRVPGCRKNHAGWVGEIDAAIRASRKSGRKP